MKKTELYLSKTEIYDDAGNLFFRSQNFANINSEYQDFKKRQYLEFGKEKSQIYREGNGNYSKPKLLPRLNFPNYENCGYDRKPVVLSESVPIENVDNKTLIGIGIAIGQILFLVLFLYRML